MANVDAEGRPIDPRRDLGRRPGEPQPPTLHIQDDFVNVASSTPMSHYGHHVSLPAGPISPPSPSSPSPTPPARNRRSQRPSSARGKAQKVSSSRGLYETQKLLSHLLDRLESREQAPDILHQAAVTAREASGRVKGKGKGRVVRIGQVVAAAAQTGLSVAQGNAGSSQGVVEQDGVGSLDFDDRLPLGEGDIDTEATYDLVEQTRNLLVLANRQNLDLFGATAGAITDSKETRARNKRNAGRLSSLASPVSPAKGVFEVDVSPNTDGESSYSGPNLLSRIMSVLKSLISEDCVHRIHLFRPRRPPHVLQATCLDVATYLYHVCDTDIRVQVTELVIEALYSMDEGFTERICEWLEGRLGELLGRLAKERGEPMSRTQKANDDPLGQTGTQDRSLPTFAISTAPNDSHIAASTSKTSGGWVQYSPTSPTYPFFAQEDLPGLLSTHAFASEHSPLALQMGSLVSRLLLAITSTVKWSSSKLTTIHRIHRILSLVLTAKPDAALDLIEIVAFSPPEARRSAVEILSTFFPNAVGHNVIAKRPALTTYPAQLAKWESGQDKALGEEATEDHHFFAWRISSRGSESHVSTHCSICEDEIHGFGLRCSLCRDLRHLRCHQQTEDTFLYNIFNLSANNTGPKIIYVSFSRCPSRLDETVLDGAGTRGTCLSTHRRIGPHVLQLVNLFTATICHECHEPLWGSTSPVYACMTGCQRFFHPGCSERLEKGRNSSCQYGRDIVVDDTSSRGVNPFAIRVSDLQACFNRDQGAVICLSPDQITERSYDEIAILYGVLWAHYQTVKNSLSNGSIQPFDEDNAEIDSDILHLRPILKLYEEFLRSHDSETSSAAADFAHVANTGQLLGQGYLYSERYLSYCTALLRAPSGSNPPSSPDHSHGFLTAHNQFETTDPSSDTPGAFEMLELSVIARTLSTDLSIRDLNVATLFLDQLRAVGMISVASQPTIERADLQKSTWCSFTLPLLMDSSPTVELLILAIEVLLSEIDLTMNEVGFNLLINKAWPSLLCSPYALERLGGAIVDWVMSQEECLHEIVRQYASKHRRLPGVRNTTSRGNSSVSVYKDDRVKMQERYARPWLQTLYDQNPDLYAHIVYEQCKYDDGLEMHPERDADQMASYIANRALDRMTCMVDADLVWIVHLDLVTAWLEDLGSLASKDIVYRSLAKLLRPDPKIESKCTPHADLWMLSSTTASEGTEGLARVCRWMRVLAFSGVEVPWQTLTALIDLLQSEGTSVKSKLDLVVAVNANGRAIEPAEFARLCARLFVSSAMVNPLQAESNVAISDLLRQAILVVLRAYGVPLDDVILTSLDRDDLKTKQPSSAAKRQHMTVSAFLLSMDEDMIRAAAMALDQRIHSAGVLLDFLWLLFTKSSSAANIDGFLHKNVALLYPSLWNLVDDEKVDSKCRTRVFLRLLAVNSAPMEEIVKAEFRKGDRTRLRERLFKFVLELADETLTAENISWRRAAVGLVILFFEALTDALDVNPDNMIIVKSLLPVQLRAISGCFEEYLVQSSDERRLGLLSHLHRLQACHPKWTVLSWRIVEEILVETTANISYLTPSRKSHTTFAISDARTVRANVISLGLNMLATGIETTWDTAQRFQQHVARACELPWVQADDAVVGLILPALRSVLDSSHSLKLGNQSVNAKSKDSTLIGTMFVPIVIDMGSQIEQHDTLAQRVLLDLIMVIFFKQSTRNVELAALGAMQTLADFVETADCVESRLLAIQILQTAMTRVERDSLARVVPSVYGVMARVLIQENMNDKDAVITAQSRQFLRSILQSFGRSRLFIHLFQNESANLTVAEDRFSLGKALKLIQAAENPVLNGTTKLSVADLALNDLTDVLKRGPQTVQQVLEALERFTSSIETELSEEAAINFGGFLTRLGKHVAEWDIFEFDPNPILMSCSHLLVLAPQPVHTTLLHQTSTLLYLCLARFQVESETITALFKASEGVANAESAENTLKTVLFELTGSMLHGLPTPSKTIFSLLHFLNHDAFSQQQAAIGYQASVEESRLIIESASGCVNLLLRSHPTMVAGDIDPDVLVGILIEASTIMLKAELSTSGSIGQHASNLTKEAVSVQLGLFTYILLGSLSLPMGAARSGVVALYPVIGRALSLCLQATADLLPIPDALGDGVGFLSTVFSVFRLAVLAIHDPLDDELPILARGESGGDLEGLQVMWNRIWPDWYRLLSISCDPKCVNGPLRATSHSVFFDILIFLGATQSPILTSHAGPLAHALRMLTKHQGSSMAHGGGRMVRAENALQQSGLDSRQVDWKGLIATVKSDLIASERLKALRSG